MSAGAIIMMVIGLGTVWGGAFVTILIALSADKKNNLKPEGSK
ncbi:MAG: MetS family NSS transporter small subunit [Clostridiaceae bacterium]|nr:MetS family NSS transporter small subunit [Clostridiaceae bacterium]